MGENSRGDGFTLSQALRLNAALDAVDRAGLTSGERKAAEVGTFLGKKASPSPTPETSLPSPPDSYPNLELEDDTGKTLIPPFFKDINTEPDMKASSSPPLVEPPPLEAVPEVPAEPEDDLRAARLAIYLRLVALGEEDETTSSERYPLGFLPHVALTVLDAQQYGLCREEIQVAMQIGAYRGGKQPQQVVTQPVVSTGEQANRETEEDGETQAAPQQVGLDLGQQTPHKLHTYLSLIQTVETHTRMVLTPLGEHKEQVAAFAIAQALAAKAAGLSESEVLAALAIALYRAGWRSQAAPTNATESEAGAEQPSRVTACLSQ